MAPVNVTLPDGTELELADGATGADAAAAIGPGLARAALAVRQNGEVRDLARPLVARRAAGDHHRQDRRRAGRHPPRRRARARRRGDGALSGREDLDRPADRERLLLRLRVPRRASRSPTRTSSASSRRCASTSTPTSSSCARTSASRQALERFRAEGQDYKVELIEDLVANADPDAPLTTVSLYTNGPFTDLCRGPHGPGTKRIKAVKLQSVAGAYWRGDAEPPAAHAHLRHGVLLQGGARRAPRAPRAGPRARPPQARQGARAVHVQRAVARLAVLAAGRDGDLERAVQALARGEPRAAATARSRRRSSTTSTCSSSPATGTRTARTCTSPTSRTARWASSR